MKIAAKFPIFLFVFLAFMSSSPSFAGNQEYETFDGRTYNGKFYPRVDIIEWSEENLPSQMEFQNYGYNQYPIDMTFELETKTGKPVMLVRYHIKNRNEYLCRRVVAPGHFKEGFFVYKKREYDREITYVSMVPLPEMAGRKEVKPESYATCVAPDENRMPASEQKKGTGDQKAKRTTGAFAPNSKAVPFGDL